jgi:imidazolonepropionase-like amidohydrolase
LLAVLLYLNLSAQIRLVIENVNIISMTKEQIDRGKSVVIQNGKIVRIVNKKELKISQGERRINANGAFMLPGLFDMHLHFYHDFGLDEQFLKEEIKLPLANGVTTVRIMDGQDNYLHLKKRVDNKELAGPEIFVASPQFVGKWPFKSKFSGYLADSASAAGRMVEVFKNQGYSEIKLAQFITPEVYEAVTTAAKQNGIKVTGHVGPGVKLFRALNARQQIEHMDEFMEALLSDTMINDGKSLSDVGIWNKKGAWPTLQYVDESKIAGLIQRIKEAGIYITPTNYFFVSFFARGATPEQIRKLPGYAFVPAFHKKNVNQAQEYFWNDPPPEAWRAKYIDIRYKLVNALHEAGVNLMAGSDGPEWYLAPGFALHSELQAFTEAGLSNYAALQTATINPARYLGIDDRKGTIEPGKEADFILLEKNPLADIQNTRSITGVCKKGKFYSRKELDKLLSEAMVIGSVTGE